MAWSCCRPCAWSRWKASSFAASRGPGGGEKNSGAGLYCKLVGNFGDQEVVYFVFKNLFLLKVRYLFFW